jgi:flagellin
MALTVATNTGALMAQAAASSVNKDMEMSMERLATGKRINGASDDAAGVAIASRLTSEIRGTNQAIRNAMDGQAMIDTAEGAHQEIENILQRMRELAVQSANDTNDATDRTNLQLELDALTNEIDRISSVTSWAGQSILTGTGGTSTNGQFTFQVGSQTNSADAITASINSMSAASLGVGSGNAVASATAATMATVGGNVMQMGGTIASGDNFQFSLNGDTISITINDVTTGSASGDVTYAYTITDSSGTEIASAGTGSGSYTGSAGDSLLESAAGVVAAVINAAEALDGSASSGGHSGINAVAASDGSVTVTQAVNVTSATGSGGAYASGAAVGNGAITGTTSVNVSTATTTVTFGSGDLDIANIGSGGTAETFTLTVNGETITYDTSGGDYAENIGGLVAGLQEQIDANTNLKGVTITAASGGTSDELVLSLVSSVTLGSVSVSNAAATSSLDITTSSGSKSAIDAIDTAIQTVNSQRANLGAISNRLDSTVSNLTNISSNLQAGRGRIEDADFAAETTSLAKSQILQQASTAMLAQANASKQNVLSLLQG